MLTLNGKNFAKNDKEMVDSLFNPKGTCVGFYRVNQKSISILNLQKEKIGVIANNVLARATRQDDGRYWYSYGDVDLVGSYDSFAAYQEEIDNICREYLNK